MIPEYTIIYLQQLNSICFVLFSELENEHLRTPSDLYLGKFDKRVEMILNGDGAGRRGK